MGVVTNNVQLGVSLTPTNNFTITAEAADGTMKLSRGNAGATTQDIFSIAPNGDVTFTGAVNAGIGSGQTWQNVLPSRLSGTVYTNTTGKPIMFNVSVATGTVTGTVDGIKVTVTGGFYVSAIVPNGSTYSATTSSTLAHWAELR